LKSELSMYMNISHGQVCHLLSVFMYISVVRIVRNIWTFVYVHLMSAIKLK